MGRPSSFTQEMADKVCELLADGMALRQVCEPDDMPSRSAVFKWLNDFPAFASQYARAKEEAVESEVDQILEIADDARNDWMEINGEDDAGWRQNGEAIQRSRLRIDARKWRASKLNAKKYGDKQIIGGDPDNPVNVVNTIERRIVRPNPSN